MNTYEGPLRDSIARSLAALADRHAVLRHGQALAQDALYHAKGAVLAARDRLEDDRTRRDARHRTYRALQVAHRAATRLQGNLALAQQGSEAALGNAATTAANLEASAGAVVELASTVGAALNVASAALYDSDLFHRLARINACLNPVANQAVHLAQQALDLSVLCAERISGPLAAPGEALCKRLDALQAQVGDTLTRDEVDTRTDREGLDAAIQCEGLAEGAWRDAESRAEAMADMLRTAVRQTNSGLGVTVVSAGEIRLRFDAYRPPFAPGGAGGLPDPQAMVHLAIVPQNRADAFDRDQAAHLFAQWQGDDAAFTAVQPGESSVALRQDVYGSAIRPGQPYCAFLLIRFGSDYQRCFGRQVDLLSVASAPFVPQTPMPAVVFAGAGATPETWFLAWPLQGQIDADPPADDIAALSLASEKLAPELQWLTTHGAELPPDIALKLDSVVPPFGDAVRRALDAFKANDRKGADAAHDVARRLLDRQREWPAWTQQKFALADEVAALRAALEDVGALMARIAAPVAPGARKPDGEGAVLRCILLDCALDAALADCAARGAAPDLFAVSTAEQIAPAHCIEAERLAGPPDGVAVPAALAGRPCAWYAVRLEDDATDNFGNALLPGHRYLPVVLSVMQGANPQGWAPRLNAIDRLWQVA